MWRALHAHRHPDLCFRGGSELLGETEAAVAGVVRGWHWDGSASAGPAEDPAEEPQRQTSLLSRDVLLVDSLNHSTRIGAPETREASTGSWEDFDGLRGRDLEPEVSLGAGDGTADEGSTFTPPHARQTLSVNPGRTRRAERLGKAGPTGAGCEAGRGEGGLGREKRGWGLGACGLQGPQPQAQSGKQPGKTRSKAKGDPPKSL